MVVPGLKHKLVLYPVGPRASGLPGGSSTKQCQVRQERSLARLWGPESEMEALAGWAPSGGPETEAVPSPGIPWCPLACRGVPPSGHHVSSVCPSLFFPYKDVCRRTSGPPWRRMIATRDPCLDYVCEGPRSKQPVTLLVGSGWTHLLGSPVLHPPWSTPCAEYNQGTPAPPKPQHCGGTLPSVRRSQAPGVTM